MVTMNYNCIFRDFSSYVFRGALLVGMLLISTACGNESEVIAEYEGGAVTRGELRHLFRIIQEQNPDALPSTQMQNDTLRNLALLRISAIEAGTAGLDKSEEYENRKASLDKENLMNAYRIVLQDQDEDRIYDMLELQFLFLTDTKAASESGSERKEEAEDLLKRLNASDMSQSDVEALIAEKTENGRYRALGGYLDPHCLSCDPNPLAFLTDPLKDTKTGVFVRTVNPGGIWLVRKVRLEKTDTDDLPEIFEGYHRKTQKLLLKHINALPEKAPERAEYLQMRFSEKQILDVTIRQSKGQVSRQKRGLLRGKLEELKTKHDFQLHEAGSPGPEGQDAKYTKDVPLYDLDGETYTYGMLLAELPSDARELTASRQLSYMQNLLIPVKLIEKSGEAERVRKSGIYAFLNDLRRNETLARLFFKDKQDAVSVTDQEIQEWFDLRKFTEYKGKKLADVRASIRNQLEANKKRKAIEETQNDLLNKYKFKISREALKPDEI